MTETTNKNIKLIIEKIRSEQKNLACFVEKNETFGLIIYRDKRINWLTFGKIKNYHKCFIEFNHRYYVISKKEMKEIVNSALQKNIIYKEIIGA